MYIKRAIEGTVLRISETFPVLLITGPRQVGKTTLLKHLASESRSYVSPDDPDIRSMAKTDPALIMQRGICLRLRKSLILTCKTPLETYCCIIYNLIQSKSYIAYYLFSCKFILSLGVVLCSI